MSSLGLLPLPEFAALVEATDPDAAYRLAFLRQAAPTLYGGSAPAEQQEAAADKLERWRYQLLNKNAPNLSANQRRLADLLDLAASVARSRPRPPKDPRSALAAPNGPSAAETRAIAALDPALPLDEVIRAAAELTARHFAAPGVSFRRRMTLYAPLYLSNFCVNHCLYCSFRYPQPLLREHLDTAAVLAQAEILRRRGFRHLLLVAGDFPRLTSADYFAPLVTALAGRGFQVAVEIAAQSTLAYTKLARAGACGVTLYQETYQEDLYGRYHPLGPKTWYDWRLEAPERAAEAGLTRLGLGILLGLADPGQDLRALVRHGEYLLGRFPAVRLALGLPRLHEAPAGFEPPCRVDDETFLRLYCALRLAFPVADLVLSTREPPALRDRLARICITRMSAGSSTAPGGYTEGEAEPCGGQQFPVSDHRPAAEVAEALHRAGFEVCWELVDGAPAGNVGG